MGESISNPMHSFSGDCGHVSTLGDRICGIPCLGFV